QENIKNDEITVVAPYRPTVSDAFKINISPRIQEDKLVKPEFDYAPLSKEFKYTSVLEPITAAKIQGESVSKLYKNYVRAGFGNYATPYIEFFANKLRSKKSAFGVHIRHLSSAGKIKDYAFPGNSNTKFKAFGKKFFNKHTFTSDVYYNRKGVHYYGYKPDEFPRLDLSKKDIKQAYNRVGVHTLLESNYTSDRKVDHYLGASYYYLFDKFESTEHNIRFDAGINKQMEFFSFSETEKLGIETGVDYYLNNDSLVSHNSGIIKVLPFYTLAFDQYFFKAGINTSIQADSNSSVNIYPVLRAEVKVVEDYLITYAGLTGELKNNSYGALTGENPFISPIIEKRFTNNKISQYGGVKGRIAKSFDYNLSFVNSTVDDMPLFINDTVSALGDGLNNQFTVVYDNVKHTLVLAEFGFHYKDKFNAMLRGKYNSYFLDNEDEAWHKPKLELSLHADYSMQDKILIKADLFSRSKMYAKLFSVNETTGETEVVAEELAAMIDLNLGFEYRYSKVLSGFLNLNNILGQRYEHWYNYPSYRFNFLLGVSYSF
ncbi:MAG: hypothetical protein K8S16_02360, partial [Bacteroidales bacterium]|nr:hypothetical protein [Bacteroidales bacterium]